MSERDATLPSVKPDALKEFVVPGTDRDVVDAYSTMAQRATQTVLGFEDEVCVLDIETTGYDSDRDRIIEVAAAIMRGPEILDRFETLVDPLIPIPKEITKLTGITDRMVEGMPCAEEAVSALSRFADGRQVVAHNGMFDRSFLEKVGGPGCVGGEWVDSLVLVRLGMSRLRSHRLCDLAQIFVDDVEGEAHRAAYDVEVLSRVWRTALIGIGDLDRGVLGRIADLARSTSWPERYWIERAADVAGKASYDLKEVRRTRVAADKADTLVDADDLGCACPDPSEVLAEFSAEGIAGRMYDGFEARQEQVEMAGAVLEAFGTSTHVAIEAGTGVGKSIAYLVPAARFALMNGVGVGVATKTNALMDQLVHHELPRLDEALGGGLRHVALKGYDHYPCLRKLERLAMELEESADADRVSAVAMLLAWTSQSSWGDLDSINMHWRRDIRSTVQASQADCTHKRCRYFPYLCYLHGVRRRASSAHIVVTNHALLFRDVISMGGILPPIRHWVVDEAHAAESEARKQLTMGAGHQDLSVILASLHGRRGGLLEGLRKRLRNNERAAEVLSLVVRMEDEIGRCATLTDSMFDFVKDLAPLAGDSDYDGAELWVTQGVRESGPWGTVASTGRSLARRIESVITDGRELMTMLEQWGSDYTDQRADLAGLLTRLADQHAGLVAVVDGEDESLVYSAELDRRPGVPVERLIASRLDIGEALAQDMYPRSHSVVFTSATIATGESFAHFAHSVGLDRLPDTSVRTLRLTSSYDFERQMAVYVPTDMPEPREATYLDRLTQMLEQVHKAMGGSVLTLFTNRRDMERVHAALEPRLRTAGLDIIVQRRGTSAKRLRDEFLADERLSLFALKSFWEGFDAKGDTLRCVVVPKLPFGRPSDPLAQERELREGRAAWSRYVLPEAIIELKQAAGRLIRSSTDSGCLVVADARVLRMGYGRDFMRAMPVDDIEKVPCDEMARRIAERFGR